MARQRFIWPSLWTDETIAELSREERLLFIGLFSNADDEGRINANPRYLKGVVFPFDDDLSVEDVRRMRDRIAQVCKRSVRLYRVDGREYIALLHWHKWQKPKYPKPSEIPPPPEGDGDGNAFGSVAEPAELPESSRNVSGSLREDSRNPSEPLHERSSMGWDGLGRDELGSGRVGLGGGVGEPSPDPSRPPAVPAAHAPSGGQPVSGPEKASQEGPPPDATPAERAVLHELRSIPRYPFDYAEDLAFIRRLAVDYPTVDLLAEVKRWRDWLSGKPPKAKWNPRLRFRNWCEIAAKRSRDSPNGRATPDPSRQHPLYRKLMGLDPEPEGDRGAGTG